MERDGRRNRPWRRSGRAQRRRACRGRLGDDGRHRWGADRGGDRAIRSRRRPASGRHQPRSRREAQSGARVRGERPRHRPAPHPAGRASARGTRRSAGARRRLVGAVRPARAGRDAAERVGGAATAHPVRRIEGGSGARRAAGVSSRRRCGSSAREASITPAQDRRRASCCRVSWRARSRSASAAGC